MSAFTSITKEFLLILTTLIILSININFSDAHITLGRCPKLTHKENTFDIKAYEGVWYEQVRNSDFFIEKGECALDDLTIIDENEYKVLNTEISKDGSMNERHASMRLYDKKNPFNYGIKFFEMQPRADYQIFDTDYKKFAIVYSCTNLLFAKYELIWIMSRETQMTEDMLENLTVRIEKELGVSRNVFYYTNQTEELCKRKKSNN